MRVCDRHPRTRATGKIIFELEDEHFDLCQKCLYDIRAYIGDPDSENIEPNKKKSFLQNLAPAR